VNGPVNLEAAAKDSEVYLVFPEVDGSGERFGCRWRGGERKGKCRASVDNVEGRHLWAPKLWIADKNLRTTSKIYVEG